MLEELLKKIIKDVENGSIQNQRVISYYDYKNKYAILKPRITVDIELTNGKTAKIDISDFFKGELK